MATHGNRHTPERRARVSGAFTLVPDPARAQGWTLLMDGVPQSYVDLADPEHLALGYVRQIARAARAWARHGVPERVLHLGGGALTVPRLMARRWPGVAQRVVELSPELISLVLAEMPPGEAVEITVGDARQAVEQAPARAYDMIVVDAFAGAAMPPHLGTVEFARQLRRVLRPEGLMVMNVTDVPPLAFTRVQVATVADVFDEVGLLGAARVLGGRSAGNVIVLAGRVPAMATERGERLLRTGELVMFSSGTRPRMDAER